MSDAPTLNNDDRLEAIAVEIETIQGVALLKVGERLLEAQEIFRYRHDANGFGGWVDSRLCFGQSTAYNIINVLVAFGKESVQRLDTLPKAVLYALAEKSTPADLRSEVVALIEAGEKVSVAEVRALKAAPSDDDRSVAEQLKALKQKVAEEKAKAKEARLDADSLRSVNSELSSSEDRAQRALAMAQARIDEMNKELSRLKESGVIHIIPAAANAPAAPPIAEPVPAARFSSFSAYEAAVSEVFFAGPPEWQQMVIENLRAVAEDAA